MELDEKMKNWVGPMMWLLINVFYPKYKKNGVTEPDKVRKYSDEYKKDSDIIYEFLTESYVETKIDTDKIQLSTLFEQLKDWYRERRGNIFPPSINIKIVSKYLIEKRGLCVKQKYVLGLTIIVENNDK